MGLDQYLYAEKYLSNSEWRGEKVQQQFRDVVEACEASNVITKAQFPSATVKFQVGYWRKSNQIHDWFVNNCQNGEDDCKEYYVSRDQLIELRSLCQRVLDNHALAGELLPTASGFFFGSTDYDEWYFGDLQETVEIINHALTLKDEYTFTYQSSW
jgi:hypothetical protein